MLRILAGLALVLPVCAWGQFDDATLLLADRLTRTPAVFASPEQVAEAQAFDRRLESAPTTHRYDALIQELKERAGIDPDVPVRVFVDQQSACSFAGGVTTLTTIFLDGKLLDELVDLADYRAKGADAVPGRVLDSIVAEHNANPAKGQRSPDFEDLDPAAADRAHALLLTCAGFLLYHEFGHYWRLSPLQPFTVQEEDHADYVAGVLLGKAHLDVTQAKQTIDLMTFDALQRTGQAHSYAEVTEDGLTQLAKPLVMYNSQAMRKSTVQLGTTAYRVAKTPSPFRGRGGRG